MEEQESIEQRVLRVVAVKQNRPVGSVTPDMTFQELGLDSLDQLNLLFDLEGEFDIQINDEQAKSVANLREMIVGIQQLVDAKQPRPEPAS